MAVTVQWKFPCVVPRFDFSLPSETSYRSLQKVIKDLYDKGCNSLYVCVCLYI